jgi:beta-mannosidase
VSRGEQRMLLIRWTVGGKEWGNHFPVGSPPFPLERYRRWIRSIAALPLPFDAGTVAK